MGRRSGRKSVACTFALTAVLAGSLAAGGASGASAPGPQEAQPTGRLIAILDTSPDGAEPRRGPPASAIESLRRRIGDLVDDLGLNLERSIPALGALAVEPAPGQSLDALGERLRNAPGVARVEPEYRRELRLTPNDPAFRNHLAGVPAGAKGQWNLRRSGFREAWDRSRGGGALVAVIDTGIDAAHPDLRGRILTGVDYDASAFHLGPGEDESGHGTHIAGLACGQGNNHFGIVGAGYSCRLLIEKSDLTDSSIAAAIVDAARRGAKVINMSFGGAGNSSLLAGAINFAWARNVVMVAAADSRNVTDQGLPASLLQPTGTGPRLTSGRGLVVTAAAFTNKRYTLAGRGTQISIAAYGAGGRGILSTFPSDLTSLEVGSLFPSIQPCFCRGEVNGDRRFAYLIGTSMATPQVAGAAALIRAKKPRLSAAKVIKILKQTATRRSGWSQELGWGILDAGEAVEKALGKRKRRS
jgi:serine protease